MGDKLQKPNFYEAKEVIRIVISHDSCLKYILDGEDDLRAAVVSAADKLTMAQVRSAMEAIDADELNRDKLGIRVSVLKRAGYTNMYRIANATYKNLVRIDGIGAQTAEKIMAVAKKISNEVKATTVIRLSTDDLSAEAVALIRTLYIYMYAAPVREESRKLYGNYHDRVVEQTFAARPAASKIRWAFALKNKKRRALDGLEEVRELRFGDFGENASALYSRYRAIHKAEKTVYLSDFEFNSAKYYAVLEMLSAQKAGQSNSRHGLSESLVLAIDALQPDLTGLKCTLRSYQLFGTKYVLNQKCVLLGDEMGLGKTVQAIAAMVALRNEGKTHFMVVCPASVLINWCREIPKHSDIAAYKAHGQTLFEFGDWLEKGGVCVTTYETVSKLKLPQGAKLDMLVADEAHYVKNPEANRTKQLLRLRAKAGRVLFMTGTPLENKVEEMCFLVNCLQPEIARELKKIKHLSAAPVFREKLSPVYFRRTRDDVLKELPDLVINEEWCDMSDEEVESYRAAVLSRNFMSMRQVSWLAGANVSCKAERLLEICRAAREESRKILVFSFFLNTVNTVKQLLGDKCYGPIDGSVSPKNRQKIIDDFNSAEEGAVLAAQIQAGGTGLNIQCASVVVLCEPQIKPSIEHQAVSRAYRMGQVRNVAVYKLLCEDSVDERILEILRGKQTLFDNFAEESVMGGQSLNFSESAQRSIIDEEIKRFTA